MINHSEIKCVGCTACAAICPHNVIAMKRNPEGFPYPVIENIAACINCGLCEKVCPVLNVKTERVFEQKGLIAQITDEQIRQESTSGGMFSALALSVLMDDGIVYGAAYDQNFQVCHIGVSKKEDLWKLRSSKYVQSDLRGAFREIHQHLEAGKKVCFSGTPCQVEGLQSYLRKDYTNLLLIDVVCHGVSSPLIWDKYLETIKEYNPSKIYFRWKHYGYKYSTMSLFNQKHEEVYYADVETDKMLRAYFSNNCARDTCYECMFKKRYRSSDFTIWDCFQPKFFDKEFDDDRGTSAVLVHSKEGLAQLEKIIAHKLINYKFVSPDELVMGNNEMVGSVKKGRCREMFLSDATYMSGKELFEKYFPSTFLSKLKRGVRLSLVQLGVYNLFKYKLFVYRRNKAKR